MKKLFKLIIGIFFLSGFFYSNLLFARDLNQKVPGKNYTYRELLLQRSFTKQIRQNSRDKELDGLGMTFNGPLKVKREMDSEGNEKIKYSVYKRDCGDITFKEEENEKLKKIGVGSRIKFRLEGSNCEISDWEKF